MGRRERKVDTEPIPDLHRPQTHFNTSGHFWNFYFLHGVNQMPQRALRVVLWGYPTASCPALVSGGQPSQQITPADWHNTFVLGSCEMGHLNGTATLIWNNSNFLYIHRSHITWESYCSFIALIHSESILFNNFFIFFLSVTPPVVKVSRKEWP